MGRRVHELESSGEAQRALPKATENDLRVNDVEGGIARLEVALIQLKFGMGAPLVAGHTLVLEEKIRVMKIIDFLQSRTRYLEQAHHGDDFPIGLAPVFAAPLGVPPMPTASTTAPDEIDRARQDLERDQAELSRDKMAIGQRMAGIH